jgi:hypothetical protein
MSPNRIRPKNACGSFKVQLSTLLGVFLCLFLIASPMSAAVTASPSSQIFNAPPYTVTFTITVPSGTTLGAPLALTLGAPNLDFTVIPSGTTCPNVVGGTCTVLIQFQPTAAGRRIGALQINDSSGNTLLSVNLVGMSILPLTGFAPGVISTVAGNGTVGNSGDGGLASSAQLDGPTSTSVDGFGNLYIADPANNNVRKVTPTGVISTFAGTGTAGFGGDNGPATSAQLNHPMAVLVDGSGWVFIADTGNHVIRVVNAAGIISTYAGQYYTGTTLPAVCSAATAAYNPNIYADSVGDGCYANQIIFDTPVDLIVCHAGNLHVLDTAQHRERTVFRTNLATITQVGNGTPGYNGDGELNTAAEINAPSGMDMDAKNYIYIADTANNIIRKTMLTGTTPNPIATVAGTPGVAGYSGDGGLATAAHLNGPRGVRVDAAGNIYIADSNNQVIRMVNAATGIISTIAGNGTGGYSGDGGASTKAQVNNAYGLSLDEYANLYIADSQNSAVRKISFTSAPLLTFSAAAGQTSAAQDVTVMNLGSGGTPTATLIPTPLMIDQIFTPASFSLGGTDTTCKSGQSLVAGASCVLGIEFTPTTSSPASGQIAVVDNSASGLTHSITVNGMGSQTITFPNPGTQTYGVGAMTLNATASSSLSVSYSVTSGPATVSGNALKITGAGTVVVQATQSGSSTYSAATPVNVSFLVNPEAVSYTLAATTPSPINLARGANGTVTLSLTSTNYAGTVTFVTSISSPSGTVSAVTATASPVTLTAGSTGTSSLVISTTSSATNHAPAVPWKGGGAVMLCAMLLGGPFAFRRKRTIAVLLTALAISMAGFLMACGSSTAARTYTVTVTPTGTATPAGAVTLTNPTPVSMTVVVQ